MRQPQASSVQRRVSSSQPSPNRPVASDATAKANGTVNPTYPRYNTGGWNAMSTWFWSSGLGPGPSNPGHGSNRPNGWAGPARSRKKKVQATSITSSTQPTIGSVRRSRKRQATSTR